MNRNRKGFTLIELLIVVVIVGILALAAIPLITSNTRDARRAEGEQLLGSARDAARVEYSKTNTDTAVLAALAADATAFTGSYFTVGTGAWGTAAAGYDRALATNTTADGTGTISFLWSSGSSTIIWT